MIVGGDSSPSPAERPRRSLIVLMGNCGAARIADIVHRLTGVEVRVLDWNDVETARALHPDLVYVDLFGFDVMGTACVAAAVGAPLPHADLGELHAVVAGLNGLPVVYRAPRRPSAGAFGLLERHDDLEAWFDQLDAVVAGRQVLDVQGLWATHGIPMDDIAGGLGHGEPLGGGDALGAGPDAVAESMYHEARWVESIWASRMLPPIACVAIDLEIIIDGELLADDFASRNPAWTPESAAPERSDLYAWWHLDRGLHEALRIVTRRGLSLALITHHGPGEVERRLRRRRRPTRTRVMSTYADLVERLPLDYTDFAHIAGGSQGASAHCLAITDALHIAPWELLYLTTSADRRDEVLTNVPAVTVPDLTGQEPRRLLLHGPRMSTWSRDVQAGYRTGERRQSAATNPVATPSATTATHTVIAVRPAAPSESLRVEELLILATTMNLTGQRPRLDSLDEVWVGTFASGGVDHGIVSVGLVSRNRLLNWVCSCEVNDRSASASLLQAQLEARPDLQIEYRDTGTNAEVVQMLHNLGITDV